MQRWPTGSFGGHCGRNNINMSIWSMISRSTKTRGTLLVLWMKTWLGASNGWPNIPILEPCPKGHWSTMQSLQPRYGSVIWQRGKKMRNCKAEFHGVLSFERLEGSCVMWLKFTFWISSGKPAMTNLFLFENGGYLGMVKTKRERDGWFWLETERERDIYIYVLTI